MARLLLGVTGSVAATRTPALYGALRQLGHRVRVVATEPAFHFFDPAELGEGDEGGPVFRDSDEWPASPYARGDAVPHIDFRDWAEVLVVAPLDANTLGKFAQGLADNFLTCVFRAWNFERPVLLAPAMNTLMWRNPVTLRHLRMLLEDHGDGSPLPPFSLDEADEIFARHAPGMVLIPPISKRLACGDFGVGAMAEVATLAEVVRATLGDVTP
ncbi:flavoprotein [Isosphaeraceae bacterium EP7]